jgi:hypothetical protein
MRMGCAVTALVIATAACGSSAAAPTGSSTSAVGAGAGPCGPSSAKTLVADTSARIFSQAGNVYGCARGHGHNYLLGQASGTLVRPIRQNRVGNFTLAGVDAGYSETLMGVDTLSAEVVVRRLDDGRTIHTASATTKPLGPEFFQSVLAIVVKADGAVAWVATGGSIIRHGKETELDRIDKRGETTLDGGAGIDARSLRLNGSRLSWRHGVATRSATLV